jgi:hypothetical protein
MMTLTSIVGDGKEHVVTTLITTIYNGEGSGGGSANHELIATNAPPYEHTF